MGNLKKILQMLLNDTFSGAVWRNFFTVNVRRIVCSFL